MTVIAKKFLVHYEGDISKPSVRSESSGLAPEVEFSVTRCVFICQPNGYLKTPSVRTVTLKLLSVPPDKGAIKLFKKRHNVKLEQVLSELLRDRILGALVSWHAVNEGCM